MGNDSSGESQPRPTDRHHGVDELGHACLTLGGDESSKMVRYPDDGRDECDAHKIDDGLLIEFANLYITLFWS